MWRQLSGKCCPSSQRNGECWSSFDFLQNNIQVDISLCVVCGKWKSLGIFANCLGMFSWCSRWAMTCVLQLIPMRSKGINMRTSMNMSSMNMRMSMRSMNMRLRMRSMVTWRPYRRSSQQRKMTRLHFYLWGWHQCWHQWAYNWGAAARKDDDQDDTRRLTTGLPGSDIFAVDPGVYQVPGTGKIYSR